MKVSIESENNFIVFLNNVKFDFENKDELEKHFREIFNQIKMRYNMDINGYYEICVYKDELCGMMISIKKEDIEYFNCFDNEIEMRIIISPCKQFIYKLENNDLNVELRNCDIYIYKGKIYIKPNKKIKNIEFIKILEYTTIIYGEEVEKILRYGKKV